MNRREFLKCVASVGVVTAFSSNAIAGLGCGPIFPPGLQNCRAGIDSNIALRVARIQQQSQWCWAACIQMIFAYNGFQMSQSEIVAATWGNVVNMPASDAQIMTDLNRPWIDNNGIAFSTHSGSVDPASAAHELANNMPLIICTLGHAMVLTALDYVTNPYTTAGEITQAIVRDPWQNNGRRTLTAQEWYSTNLLLAVRCV